MSADTRAALELATVRLEILQDRMRGCPAHEADSVHDLSILEIEGWIEEQRDLLARSAPEEHEKIRRWSMEETAAGIRICEWEEYVPAPEERGEPDGGIVYIARCPIHGLHGARTECYECGGPVEQVPMRRVGAPAQEPNPLTGPPHPDDATERGFRCRPASAPPVAQGAEEPADHQQFEEARSLGLAAMRKKLSARRVAQEAEPSLDDELHDLHDRLRDEGRDADADIIDRAAWALAADLWELRRAPVAQGAEEPRLRCPTFGRSVEYQTCDCEVCKPGPAYEPRRHRAIPMDSAWNDLAGQFRAREADGGPLISAERGPGAVPQGLPREETALYLWNLAQGSKSLADYLPSALAHLHTLEQMAALDHPVAGSEEREHEMWVAIHAAYRHGYGRGASDEAANLFHITRATNEYMDNLPSRSALLLAALRGEREA